MLRTLSACALMALPLSAQDLTDTIPYPDGNIIPGWTTQAGSWSVKNKMLVGTGGWAYLTHVSLTGLQNCVIDTLCVHPGTSGVYFAGSVARHPGSGSGAYGMTKIQDNSSAGNWNRLYAYERPTGGSKYVDPTIKGQKAMVRSFYFNDEVWALVDADLDGVFEQQTARMKLSATTSGLAGVSAYNGGMIDTFKLYKGVLLEDPTTAPKIGTTYKMDFHAPLRVLGGNPVPTPWLGMLAAGNKGIPLPGGQAIPLSFDALWVNSFAFGFAGSLTKASPSATMSLAIPNDKSLVGFEMFACALTLGFPNPPLGIGAISNDHHIKIQ